MLKNYKGGDEVSAGFYCSATRWSIDLVDKRGGVLPGAPAEKYVRLPVPVMLVVAPVLGAAFVIFLPLIGFIMLGVFAWRAVAGRLSAAKGAVEAAVEHAVQRVERPSPRRSRRAYRPRSSL